MMMMLFRKHPLPALAILLLLALLLWSYWGTTALVCTPYRIRSEKLPPAFDGFRIAQVSDLHNTTFGKDHGKLLAMLTQAQPELIAITGDLVDSRRTDVAAAVSFVREAVKIAPVCYTPGNHESRIPEAYSELKAALSELGVIILENGSITLEKDSAAIAVTGLLDPNFQIPWPEFATDHYQVVLSHRPELLAEYAGMGFDLVLTGHAHGGQFRLPFTEGLFAPQQGFFPRYTAGVHTQADTTMVISRGLGNVPILPRFNNRPEVVLITLESL